MKWMGTTFLSIQAKSRNVTTVAKHANGPEIEIPLTFSNSADLDRAPSSEGGVKRDFSQK